MAKQQPATVKPATYTMEVPGHGKQELPLFGPFGDKALHGTKLVYDLGQSETVKRKGKQDETLARSVHLDGTDYWAISCYAPASDEETKHFANTKPANVGLLLTKAMMVDARYQSWKEQRGGTTTTNVSVDGAPAKALPNVIVDMLRAAGHTVVEVAKVKPTK